MRRLSLIALLSIVCEIALSTVVGQVATPVPVPIVSLEMVSDGLVDPVSIRQPPDDSDRLFVVEKIGRIRIIERGALLDEPFLDLTSTTISASPEQGMYDIAFHPRFASNGLVYVSHTERYLNGALVVWEYQLEPDNPNQAARQNRRPVIAVQRRAMFHNGGTIGFGPDGYLYVGVGEGRPYQYSWAPSVNLAQTLDNLDGKILRIDVDVPLDPDGVPVVSYLVPPNPFGGSIAREYAYRADMDMHRGVNFPEIWSYGLRNPWRFAFDPVTGDLFLPDVGEFDMEEINWQPANSTGGENYGWDAAEGTSCSVRDCTGFVAPVHAYPHDEDHCAVIGIGISRAVSLPALQGSFLFSDYCAGDVSALQMRNGTWRASILLDVSQYAPDRQVSGGGMDRSGNVYLTTCTCASTYDITPASSAERETGAVWRLVPLPAATEPSPIATPVAAIPFPLSDSRWTMPSDRLVAVR